MAPPILKLAVIGSGPAAFYAVARVLSSVPSALKNAVRVHMYDSLWAPHGLVRYGVAPDHPEVKNCINKFHEIASDPRFRFVGNVDVVPPSEPFWPTKWTISPSQLRAAKLPGSGGIEQHRLIHPNPSHALPLGLSSLFRQYTHLLIASGAPIPTLHSALRPASRRIIPALDMVHWYTGHPNSSQISSLIPTPLPEHVTVVGVGNVALDVARILLSDPARLEPYGLPEHVMKALRGSKVKHVSIIGRRGPREASFTAKEVRELMNLDGVAFTGIDTTVMAEALSEDGGKKLERQKKRVLDILRKGSPIKVGSDSARRTWSLEFWRSPTAVAGASGKPVAAPAEADNDLPMQLTLAHTALSADGRVKPTGDTSTLETSLIVTALGHICAPETTPFCDPELGHIRTVGGSFTHPELQMQNETGQQAADATATELPEATGQTSTTSPLASSEAAAKGPTEDAVRKTPAYGQVIHPVTLEPMPRVYAAGWAARGAKGVLGTTMLDAHAVGEAIIEDWLATSGTAAENAEDASGLSPAADKELQRTLADVYETEGNNDVEPFDLNSIPNAVITNLNAGKHRENIGGVTYEEWLELDKAGAGSWQEVKQLLANSDSVAKPTAGRS